MSGTVHEDITDAAIRCAAERWNVGRDGTASLCIGWERPVERQTSGNKHDPLIRGIWWNDDPNQLLFGVHYGTWVAYQRDARGIARNGKDWLGRWTSISPTYKMQYRSHYGDLQFLHAMANADGEPAGVVKERIIAWFAFAYLVATREIEPDTTLANLQLPIVARHFARQPGWTVNHLFAPKFTLGKATIPDVALGSMLHVIQDSFSAAHAARIYEPSVGCLQGRITEFNAYGNQDPKRHGVADRHEG